MSQSTPNMNDIMHISPLRESSREFDDDWVSYCSSHPIWQRSTGRSPRQLSLKLEHLQTYHWIALVRAVEKRATWKDGKIVAGGWNRQDFMGMVDWYRCMLKQPAWWHNAHNADPAMQKIVWEAVDASHDDGMWLTVLLTSPWAACPQLEAYKGQNKAMLTDSKGALVVDNSDCVVNGLPSYASGLHRSDAMQQLFLDKWERVANEWPLRKLANGDVVTPLTMGRNVFG